jgi:hypothetical protein
MLATHTAQWRAFVNAVQCGPDLQSADFSGFHFVLADALMSGFPCWVQDSGEVRISVGTRVFRALLYIF